MRKSTEEAERQVLSLASQEDQIKKQFGDLTITYWLSESKSAAEPNKRPEFNKLLALIDSGEIDGIIAWHPDRLSRNEMDAANIGYRARKGYLKDLKFVSGFTFENTPEGIMMLQLTMAQSQHFSSKLSKDVKRGNERKRQTGGLTGLAPQGYLNRRTSTAGRGEAVVEKDPERFDLVRKAFDLFLTGEYSLLTIRDIMNNEWGYRTVKRNKVGGTPLSRPAIYKMFRNVRYAGLIPDPNNADKFYPANFPAMITREEYDQVQLLLGRDGAPRLSTKKQFDLRGFIRCANCDCMITAERKYKTLKDGAVVSYDYYHCTGKRGCAQRSVYIREKDLVAQLDELLKIYEISPKMYEWAMETLRKFSEHQVAQREAEQAMQRNAITGIQHQLDKLLDMATRGLIDDEVYRSKGASLKDQLKQLHDEQADFNYRVKSWYENITQTFELLTDASSEFANGDIAKKRDILLAIGQNPVLLDGKLSITPNEWLIPVEKSAFSIREALEKVRTEPLQIQKASEEAISLQWCGRRESNSHHMLGRHVY